MFSRFVVSQVKHNSYFLVGVVLGLWLALVAVPLEETPVACPVSEAPNSDEFEPHREARPLGPAGPAAGRSVQRPRYYITELGMRGSLMSGVLSSEEALSTRTAALNATAARLQPLRVFIAAAAGTAPPRPNVVAFTDTREMLKPFHALKYLADNYLEEFDFFFLVSDTSFVNARRLRDLVGKLSVSRDVYMGTVAEDDSHYCTLEGGILLSNSVLRAVHGELDWCVRNSYSAHHHENIGRCVLHAAHIRCHSTLQGETYRSVRVGHGAAAGEVGEGVGEAVTAHPLADPRQFYALHAHAARLQLRGAAREEAALRARLAAAAGRLPRGYRNATWPRGLRMDVGLAPPPPDNRFSHLRWTPFNATHALLPDDRAAVAALRGAQLQAVQLVLNETRAWAVRRWGGGEVQLAEGAWRWEPPYGLRYRLLLRLRAADGTQRTRAVEACRALGPARLAPAPYVTESARLHVLLPVPATGPRPRVPPRALAALAAAQPDNSLPVVVIVRDSGTNESTATAVREELASLLPAHPQPLVLEAAVEGAGAGAGGGGGSEAARVQRAALEAALGRVPRDALVLLLPASADFNRDFLNRVRMNCIAGAQWFWPAPFARYPQPPRAAAPQPPQPPQPPQHHTGRFADALTDALAFYRSDYEAAAAAWRGAPAAPVADLLAAAPLRCLRAPEPALLLPPAAAPPCAAPAPAPATGAPAPAPGAPALAPACLRAHRDGGFRQLQLGDRHTLARLLLEEQAAAAAAAA